VKFTITLTQFGKWTVHRAGCKDIKRELKDAQDAPFTKEAESLDALLGAELKNLEGSGITGYSASDFDVKPCAKG
jgi:hypothetical protein